MTNEKLPPMDNPVNPAPELIGQGLTDAKPASDPAYQEFLENREEFMKWLTSKGKRADQVVGDEYPKWIAGPDVVVADADEEKKARAAHKKAKD